MEAVVQQIDVHVAAIEKGENAWQGGESGRGISVEKTEGTGGLFFVPEVPAGIIGAIVMIVPDRVIGSIGQQPSQVRNGAVVRPTLQNPSPTGPVCFSQVDVVPQPDEDVGIDVINALKYFVASTVRVFVTQTVIAALLVYVGTTAKTDCEVEHLVTLFTKPPVFGRRKL